MSPSPTPDIIQNRFLSFLIWQTIQSTAIFTLAKALLSALTKPSLLPSPITLLSLLLFLLSMLLFSLSLHSLSSPSPRRPASPPELALALVRLLFAPPPSADFVQRARVSLGILLFVFASAASGGAAVVSLSSSAFPGSFAELIAIVSWELILHLHKVLHTKIFIFASSNGSAAVEANPSKPLLVALEESSPRSLLQYLAYLDLCMVCGSNVDPWRRSAFFEETGDTYKRVVAACLRPLELLASKLTENSADNACNLSHQLCSAEEIRQSSEILESFNDFQLYAWSAQAVASLEVHSHKEDRFGVAQISGSHATVLSTLLSCLVAVEAFMGKKINLQSPNHMLGPAGIKWATNSAARTEIATAMNKKRGSPSHLKSYALADVLKTSIFAVVSEFHEEILVSAKLGSLERDWLCNGKPLYGSVELLVQKLLFFLNFQAS